MKPGKGIRRVACLQVQPVQAALSQRSRLCKLQDPAVDVMAEVVQVRVHGVAAAPEVDVVRQVEHGLVPELVRDLRGGWAQSTVSDRCCAHNAVRGV